MPLKLQLTIDELIGKLCSLAIFLFLIHECIYYNLYMYGNIDEALTIMDINYSIDTSLFIGRHGGLLKYPMLGVYLCLVASIILYILHYSIPGELGIAWITMLLFSALTLIHSDEPFLYISGITAFSHVMAPGTVILMSSVFLFTREEIWNEFLVNIKIVIVCAAILSVYGFIRFPYSYVGDTYVTRLYAFKWLKGPVGCMTLLLPLSYTFWNKNKCVFQSILFILALIGAVMMQSRMSIISIFAIFFAMNYLCKRGSVTESNVKKNIGLMYHIMVAVAVLCVLCVLLDHVVSILHINNRYLSIFLNRISDDTRSSQYIEHLSIVLNAQPFGIGYPSSEVLNNYAAYGIDNGLLMTMYYCGIPMLIVFIYFCYPEILKAFMTYQYKLDDIAMVAIGCNRLMWLFSSFSPSLSIGLIMLTFSLGRCYAINREVRTND